MGVLTISLEDEAEKKLRELAKEKYGETKGAVSRLITESINKSAHKTDQDKIRKQALELLEKGFKMGKITYKTRDQLYERSWTKGTNNA